MCAQNYPLLKKFSQCLQKKTKMIVFPKEKQEKYVKSQLRGNVIKKKALSHKFKGGWLP